MFYRHCILTLLYNKPLEGFQVIQGALKLNGAHQLLFYNDYVSILGGSVHTTKEIAEDLLVGCKEI
jgi:hypothetical protein